MEVLIRLDARIMDRIDRPEVEAMGFPNYTSTVDISARQSASSLFDERNNIQFHYAYSAKRPYFIYSSIHTPISSPKWARDRSRLWNTVETLDESDTAEMLIDVKFWMPVNLTSEQYIELAISFINQIFVENGMIVDVNIHLNKPSEPHAHALIPLFGVNEDGFTQRNDQWKSHNLIESWKKRWFEHVNFYMKKLAATTMW